MTGIELEHYLDNFYGYGSWDSKAWFIGKEEGGGNEMSVCFRKVVNFNNFDINKNDLLDLRDYHLTLSNNDSKWFLPPFPLQGTWKLYLFLLMNNVDFINTKSKKDYQAYKFARNKENNCITDRKCALIELLPLPNPYDDNEWPNRWPLWEQEVLDHDRTLLSLNKDEYRENYIPPRIRHICTQIKKYKPKNIICPIGGANSIYRTYLEDLVRCIDKSNIKPGWVDILHFDGKRSMYFDINNGGTRIIITYSPTLFIAGGTGSWNRFFEPVKNALI